MNEETIQAAREAWRRDPESAARAILGVSAEELFCEAVKAAKGCNQHKHKPGCPDAEGGEETASEIDKKLKNGEYYSETKKTVLDDKPFNVKISCEEKHGYRSLSFIFSGTDYLKETFTVLYSNKEGKFKRILSSAPFRYAKDAALFSEYEAERFE